MKKTIPILILIILFISCNRQDQETPEPTDFGYLSMNISVSITEEPASGRVEAVPTDDWKVTIFNADGTEAEVFDPYLNAPAEIQLPTGEYYIEAHSNNFVEAAFDNPYYFGRSDNFQIDKEELVTIDITAELANAKVALNYSPNVTSTFDDYTGAVTVVSTGTTLNYAQGEIREGYFVAEPLSVVVDLSYTKLDGTFITRQFTANIDAQPKTLYSVNVDAALEDGKIVININVDETFNEEVVELGQSSGIETWSLTLGAASGDHTRGGLIQTMDGNYVFSGMSQKFGYNYEFWIVKVSPAGDLIWESNYGSTSSDDAHDIIELDNGELIVGGITQTGDKDVTNQTDNNRAWVIKLDAEGDLLWEKSIPSDYYESVFSIDQTLDNGIVLGIYRSGDPSFRVIKMDTNGNTIWDQVHTSGTATSYTFLRSVKATSDGGYVVASHKSDDYYIAKLDPNGNLIWTYAPQIPGSNNVGDIIENASGYLFVGISYYSLTGESSMGGVDTHIVQLDFNGNLLWERMIGGSGQDVINEMYQDGSDVYMAGLTQSNDGDVTGSYSGGNDYWIAKINGATGDLIWNRTYGGSDLDEAYDIIKTSDGGILVSGYTRSNDGIVGSNTGFWDAWLLKLDENGNY